jgi:hypothetical protein
MPHLSAMHNRLLCLFSLMLFAGVTAVQAQVPAGKGRPAAVPEGYLITPMGYFHPSCVKQLAEGDVLRPEEKAVQHRDGSFDSIPACGFAHFTARGEKVPLDDARVVGEASPEAPFIGHSWIEAIQTVTSSSYGEITSEFKVPPAPTSHDGQTIFFFPGMQDTHDVVTIIQPVLGWNNDFANAWSIASWNCCTMGTTVESSPKHTASGHVIFGEMKDTCKAGTLSCGSWNILTKDMTSGASTELVKSGSQHQTFNWGFGNVLEVYNVAKCSDYPPGGKLEAYDVNVYNDKFQKVAPSWSLWKVWEQPPTVKSPLCGYGGSSTSTTATVKY